jgi:diadenosine tetraphosphate (Ap4A) HIT family hydrolase
MEDLIVNSNSHLTAKKRNKLSFSAQFLLNNNVLNGDVLDFGCGYGTDVKLLTKYGILIHGYDKYYFPEYPSKKYDTIICNDVLSVLLPEEQNRVLMELSQLVKPSGKVFITVRRGLKYEGFRKIEKINIKTYQCNVILNNKSYYKNKNIEIYEYRHFNQIHNNENIQCPFCLPGSERELIIESESAYAMYDKYPVNNGHALIIPKKHCSDYFDLSFQDQAACFHMLNTVKEIVSKKYKPDGFNVGINIGKDAGQTIDHVHIHLIPRYHGDVEEPKGGVRGVIPGKKIY